ncbi:MAG: peptidoglycan DD-metalloendopeptidase family protein [Patescibacteria group bacterium]
MAVFLAVGALLFGEAYSGKASEEAGVFGGPALGFEITPPDPILLVRSDFGHEEEKNIDTETSDDIFNTSLRAEDVTGGLRGPLLSYVVQAGDTVSGIANKFGISPQTVLWANPSVRSGSLRRGEKLTILPVSGILYPVRDGETAESVAAMFDLTIAQLREFNHETPLAELSSGMLLIIPGGRPEDVGGSSLLGKKLESIPGYFIMPTQGFNWGKAHAHNAVDIANSCGTRVIASAEGLVVPDGDMGDGSEGWNKGYGKFILIEHPNGTQTRYAHLETVSVKIGDYTKQGDAIGAVGNTGNVHGPTGCHLHFEVYGAKNPFIK